MVVVGVAIAILIGLHTGVFGLSLTAFQGNWRSFKG